MTREVTDQERLTHDPFFGDEGKVSCRTVKLVKARRPHDCWYGLALGPASLHHIQAGERARFEKALIDGDYWGSYYMCLTCLDNDIKGRF